MNGLKEALWAECLKVRRSKMLWATLLIFAFIAIMMGLLMLVSKHPELAGKSAVISTKASLIGKPDWPSYFSLLMQMVLTVGFMGYGIVASWVFGREYSDRTVKDLLALPVSRYTIVLSKFIIVVIWSILLSLVLFMIGLLTGWAVNLDDWSGETARQALLVFSGTVLLTILSSAPVAFIASLGRGYLLPIGFVILTLIITQFVFIGIPGITPYFPWAIPALYSGVAGPDVPPPEGFSYLILILTSLSGFIGTAVWWRYADQH
jgi:ABC-2 type transport system permease protein